MENDQGLITDHFTVDGDHFEVDGDQLAVKGDHFKVDVGHFQWMVITLKRTVTSLK